VLEIFSNFHDPKLFENSLTDVKEKPISVFYDWPCGWNQNEIENAISKNPHNILILGEPNEYFGTHDFAIQNSRLFSVILTWSDDIINRCDNAVLFPFGTTWLRDDYISKMENPTDKKFEVSFLRGAKKKAPGHDLRWDLYDDRNRVQVPTKFFDVLDDFDPNTGFHTDLYAKEIVWNESMFHIAIENHSHNGYFTEKVVDAFLTKTIPIYWGCKDIDKYFDEKGMIRFETKEEAISKINNLTEKDYHDRKEYMEKNYKLALHYANFFGRFKNFLNDLVTINKL
jgi:hypothetical protein|tara:strand:+ start:198 stop:1049 length:852 start_codon:yes stop_codon:yes gene_type:complete